MQLHSGQGFQYTFDELVKEKPDKLYVTSLTYIYSLPALKNGFDKKCMQRIQDNYTIISYDFENGATIEYERDVFVSAKCTLEQIQITIQTEYDFTFPENAIKFLPNSFIAWPAKGI